MSEPTNIEIQIKELMDALKQYTKEDGCVLGDEMKCNTCTFCKAEKIILKYTMEGKGL